MATLNHTHEWKPGDIGCSISHKEVTERCPACGGEVTKEVEVREYVVILSLVENLKNVATVFSAENGITSHGLRFLTPANLHNEPMPEYPGGLRQYAKDYVALKQRAVEGSDPEAVRLLSYLLEWQDRRMPHRR